MTLIAFVLIAIPILLLGYALFIYPALLWLLSRKVKENENRRTAPEWPFITITVPAYNEEASIGATLNALLDLDYPHERRQLLVLSDASTDRTDDIVREFAHHGVELVRMPSRGGKTAVENAAAAYARGELIVNIDASVRVRRDALKPLVSAFADPTVGVASGRDVSVSDLTEDNTAGEAGYVGYEMWVRELETRVHSIVGASGCFYATRKTLYDRSFPNELSRDFAAALMARDNGFRAVSVNAAVCLVPRGRSLRGELRRKTRTMARGLATLDHLRHLMNVEETGVFAWMLISHKLIRWLFYATLPLALVGILLLAVQHEPARWVVAAGLVFAAAGIVGLTWPAEKKLPRLLSIPAFAMVTNLAGILAWWRYLSGERDAIWEPTRRTA